jgi:hypothetical protein
MNFVFFNYNFPHLYLKAPGAAVNVLSAVSHVFLLLTRTKGLLSSSTALTKLMKVLGLCFCITSASTILFAFMDGESQSLILLLFNSSTFLLGI